MLERTIGVIIDKVDAFEFACRFRIRPSNKNAQVRVYKTLFKIDQKYTLADTNIYVALAKKYNLDTDY